MNFTAFVTYSCLLLTTLFTPLSAIENLVDDSINMNILKRAWKYAGGGSRGKPYYRLVVNGVYLDGERDWAERWNLMKDSVDFEGKTILELGCNVAIASNYMIKYRNAKSAVGIELPDENLRINGNPMVPKVAKMLQKAMGVNNIELKQMNLDIANYEKILGTNYDIVVCMSLLNWVKDKERLLRYLSNFSCVIYEGHENNEVEIKRFLSHGFTNYDILGSSVVGISSPPHYKRTVIVFTK